MKIVGKDNLARETIADHLLIPWVPKWAEVHAKAACAELNKFTCDDHGGMFYEVVPDNYRLSKGLEDLI